MEPVTLNRSEPALEGPDSAPSRKRVLFLSIRPAMTSGPASNTINFLSSEGCRRNDVVFVDTSPPTPPYSAPHRVLHSIRLFARLVRALARHRPVAAYILSGSHTGFYEKVLMGQLVQAFGAGTVLHLVGGEFRQFVESSRVHGRLVPALLRRTTVVACVGSPWMDFIARIAPDVRVRHLPNPVDAGPILERTAGVQRSGATSGVRFLFIGLMMEVKGPLDLVAACVRHQSSLRGRIVVTMAGGGALLETVRKAIREGGVADFVEATGYVPEERKLELLADSDAFVLPSHAEGFPVAVLEAMAAGLPVIASRVGALPDAVDESVGRLVPPHDPDALAEALSGLADAGPGRIVLGTRARERVLASYDSTVVGEVLDALWTEAAGLANGGRS